MSEWEGIALHAPLVFLGPPLELSMANKSWAKLQISLNTNLMDKFQKFSLAAGCIVTFICSQLHP